MSLVLNLSPLSFLRSTHHHHHRGLSTPPPLLLRHHFRPLRFSTTATSAAVKKNPVPAAAAAATAASAKSSQQPEIFIQFMKSHGFNDAQIDKLISLNPRCLSVDVEAALHPKIQSLQQLGFAGGDLAHLLLSNPNLLTADLHRSVLPKLHLWVRLLGSVGLLIAYVRKNQWLLSYSLDKTVLPNLEILRSCGVSDERISMVVRKHPRLLCHKPGSLEQLVKQVEGMGVPRRSGMFLWALWTLRRVSKARLEAKREILASFGWSETDFLAAFRKAPGFLSVSEKTLRGKMEFLVREAGCEASYVALHPLLLSYSLDKRLIPRYRIMEVLKARGLYSGNYQLFSLMTISQKKFMDKFVLCYKEEVPGLLNEYIVCCNREAAF